MSDEWASLWLTVFGQPPPLKGDDALLARILIESLPNAPPYRPGPPPLAEHKAPRANTPDWPEDLSGSGRPRPGAGSGAPDELQHLFAEIGVAGVEMEGQCEVVVDH